jgi:2-hydroxychromene-2-carboxylate isomerase
MNDPRPAVEFVYDFVSVPCHIAWQVLRPMLESAGARLVLTPVLCGGIFKAIGNPGPLAVPAKRDWYQRDLPMWARRRGVALVPSPFLPVRSLHLLRGSFVAEQRNEAERYMDTVFEAIYVRTIDMGRLDAYAETLRLAGFDADAYLEGIEHPDIKRRLVDETDRAVARGVFGVPSFFVGDELFFGQDRLEFVIEAVASQRAGAPRSP